MSFDGETINANSVIVNNTNIVTGRLPPVNDIAVYVDSVGDDNNDGSVSSPFATLSRAFEVIAATGYNNTATIILASNLTINGNLSLPFVKAGQQINPIRVIGAQPTTTYTSAGNTTYSFDGNIDNRSSGISFGNEDSSKLLYVNDTDGSFNNSNTLGRFVRFNSGNLSSFQNNDQASANPVIAPIRETNDAQTLVLDFFTTNNRPTAGDNYEIIGLSTNLTFTDTILTYGSNIIFENCNFVTETVTGLGLKTIAVDDISTLTFNTCVFNCSANITFDSAVNFGANVISGGLVQSVTSGAQFLILSANEITFNKNTKLNYSNFTGITSNNIIVNGADLSLFSVSFIDCQNIEMIGCEVESDSVYYGAVKSLILRKTRMITNGLTNHGSIPDAGSSAILVTEKSYLLVTGKKNGEFVETPKNTNIISEVSCIRIEEFSTVHFDQIDDTSISSNFTITVTNGIADDANINVIDSNLRIDVGYITNPPILTIFKTLYLNGFNTNIFNIISSVVSIFVSQNGVFYVDNLNNIPMDAFNMKKSKLDFKISTDSAITNNTIFIGVNGGTTTDSMNVTLFNLDNSEVNLDLDANSAFDGSTRFSFSRNVDIFANCVNESIVNINSGFSSNPGMTLIGRFILDNSQMNINDGFTLIDIIGNTDSNVLFTAINSSKLLYNSSTTMVINNYTGVFNFTDSELVIPNAVLDLERTPGPTAFTFTNCTGIVGTLFSFSDSTLINSVIFTNSNINFDIVNGMNMVIDNGSSIYIRENIHFRGSFAPYLTLTGGSTLVIDSIDPLTVQHALPFFVCNGGSSFTLLGSSPAVFNNPASSGTLFDFTDCKSVYINNLTINATRNGINLDSVHQFNLNNVIVNNAGITGIIINKSRGTLTNVSGTGNATGVLISNNSTVAADLATNITGTNELVVGTNPASTWATIQAGAVDDITDMGALGSAPRQNCTLTVI